VIQDAINFINAPIKIIVHFSLDSCIIITSKQETQSEAQKMDTRVKYILAMYKAMEYSFSASFNMLVFYMTEQEAMNLMIQAKKDLTK
jgi:hypothetical protein